MVFLTFLNIFKKNSSVSYLLLEISLAIYFME